LCGGVRASGQGDDGGGLMSADSSVISFIHVRVKKKWHDVKYLCGLKKLSLERTSEGGGAIPIDTPVPACVLILYWLL